MLAMRAMLALQKKPPLAPEGRPASDTMMAGIASADGVTYAPAVLDGVQGWWCRPSSAPADSAILHFHGGGYVVGSAWAYRHFVGQIAVRANVAAFIPDYALAPERPFPAGVEDAMTVFEALAREHAAIGVTGDSAGGGIALALLNALARRHSAAKARCAVLLSPWADLTLSGDSMSTRADADPLLDRDTLAGGASLYLAAARADDPRASPLFDINGGLPPTMIHVGEDEVLLDDALRIALRIEERGGHVEAHIWKGMFHVFPAGVGRIKAAAEAMDSVAAFMKSVMAGHAE